MTLRSVEFRPLRRSVPFLGFGCGTLNGRASLSRSARLVETALDLGIRYFDVAPSYGGGTAEEVLGHVIGDSTEVVIATKHGIPRPPYRPAYEQIRRLAKPFFDGSQSMQRLLRRMRSRARRSGSAPVRHDFSGEATRRSLETSLRLLKRDFVDVFLAHEPVVDDLTRETAEHFADAVRNGLARCYGAAVGAMGESPTPFGDIWQSCWPGRGWADGRGDVMHVFHGALRFRDGVPCRASGADLEWRMRQFAELAPASVLIVSASTPERLREIANAARN
jgi:hypothetical protein